MRRTVAGTLALLIAVVASGCTPGATADPTPTTPATTTATPATAWESQASSPSLPAVPAGLPVMPGAQQTDPPTAEGVIARWIVEAIGPEVYQHYLDALPAAGFVVEDTFPGGNAAVIRFAAPGGMTFDLALVGEGDGGRTRIDLRLPDSEGRRG